MVVALSKFEYGMFRVTIAITARRRLRRRDDNRVFAFAFGDGKLLHCLFLQSWFLTNWLANNTGPLHAIRRKISISKS